MSKIDLVYQVSEKAFNAERDREEVLTDKAEKYIAAVVIIIGFKLINLDNLDLFGSNGSMLSSWISFLSFIVLGISLVYSLLSRRIWPFQSYSRGESLIEELRSDHINDEMAKISVAKMYLHVRECNAKINDRRARMLSVSAVLMVVGFIMAVFGHMILKLT